MADAGRIGFADRAAHEPSPVSRSRPIGEHPLRVIDMFAGIGGFSLGLHRAGGFETVAVAEVDPYASKVLEQRIGAPNLGDITKTEFPDADVICAGFPCQDISIAGKGAGLAGARSGLWREVVRAIRLVRSRFTLLENVAALLDRGLGAVLGDLAEIGHDAEWDCFQACDIGAPHRRDRWFAVAYPHGDGDLNLGATAASGTFQKSLQKWSRGLDELGPDDGLQRDSSYAGIRRVVHGIPNWVDRVGRLGNAILPQLAELHGRAILAAIADRNPKGEDQQGLRAKHESGGAEGNRPKAAA
jgi:DNA (cytosine-5)-methyltransferase 1